MDINQIVEYLKFKSPKEINLKDDEIKRVVAYIKNGTALSTPRNASLKLNLPKVEVDKCYLVLWVNNYMTAYSSSFFLEDDQYVEKELGDWRTSLFENWVFKRQ